MSKPFAWGILAPGNIANAFARDLAKLDDAELVAVGSRDQGRADAFAAKWGVPQAYGSYDALIADPDVEAIYVAPPHPFHAMHTIACLQGGKPVLCEKPLAINQRQVAQMIDTARQQGVFLMEAQWTLFSPAVRQAVAWIEQGAIGDVRMVRADFCFRADVNPSSRLFNLNLGGGGLLDVGTYTVSLAQMILGDEPQSIQAMAHIGETGVDEQALINLGYPGGALAQLTCGVRVSTAHEAWIYGTEGMIKLPAFWHATEAILMPNGQEPTTVPCEMGYHYEAKAVCEAVRSGQTEHPSMSWDSSLAIARTLDAVREQIGLVYPMD